MNEKNTNIKNQILALVDTLLEANGLEHRDRPRTGSMPTIFFEYSGHVNKFRVWLYKDGWSSGFDDDKEWEFYLDDEVPVDTINNINGHIEDALKEKTEVDVLRRDIVRKKAEIACMNGELSIMQESLRLKEESDGSRFNPTF